MVTSITPGMEEGGTGQGDATDTLKDDLRNGWKKLVDSEERLCFFKKMVGLNLQVREIEHFGEDLNSKFRSEKIRGLGLGNFLRFKPDKSN